MMKALFVAWRSGTEHSGWRPVGRLEHDGGLYRFCYTRGAYQTPFRPFTGMDDLDQVYESEELFPLFENRLLSKRRPEWESYLRWGGFQPGSDPEPLVILGVTEGIRETDAVEVFPCPAPDAEGCYMNRFFLHGIRWMGDTALRRIATLAEEEPLGLMLDLQNEYDPNAVAVRTETPRELIGYVPRYLAGDVWRLMGDCGSEFMELSVVRVNHDAPMQNRLLCRLRSCWPEGFQPCDGEEFLPIPAEVPAHCR